MMNSSISSASNNLSKFHRSMSMGQSLTNRYSYQNDDNFDHQKVVMRRKSPLTGDGDGSSSLCQPSENLRKLVPEEVFNFNAAVQSYSKMASVMMATPSKGSAITENLDAKNENDVDEQFLAIEGDPQDHEYVLVTRHGDSKAKQRCAIESVVANVDLLKPASNAALIEMPNLLGRPTIAFCFQSHNLERVRYAMKRNLRIATLRLWALQAMNWYANICSGQSTIRYPLISLSHFQFDKNGDAADMPARPHVVFRLFVESNQRHWHRRHYQIRRTGARASNRLSEIGRKDFPFADAESPRVSSIGSRSNVAPAMRIGASATGHSMLWHPVPANRSPLPASVARVWQYLENSIEIR